MPAQTLEPLPYATVIHRELVLGEHTYRNLFFSWLSALDLRWGVKDGCAAYRDMQPR